MGTAFERGFTNGLLRYVNEENAKRTKTNADADKNLALLIPQRTFISAVLNASDKAGVKVDNRN